MQNFLDQIWEFGDRTALVNSDGEKITYDRLRVNVAEFSRNLSSEQAVALLICRNVVEAIVAYLSFLNCGIVPLLLPSKISYAMLQTYISNYKPRFLFLDFKFEHKAFREVERIGQFTLYTLHSNLNTASLNPNLKVLLTTSGSTGNPKLVRISDENLRVNCEMIQQSLPISSEDIVITTLPFSYSYGLSIVNTHLLKGSAIQLNEHSVMQRKFWELLSDSKATTFGGVPFLYQQICQLGFDKLRGRCENLRYLTQAGGKMSAANLDKVYDFCIANQIDFYVMYGQTEATARMSVLHPLDATKKMGSIGKAIYPGEFALLPIDTKNNIGGQTVGELAFQGRNVAMGYATSDADLEKGDEWHGILKTGDLAYIDDDGFVFIVGRLSRFSKVRGIRLSLDDLESKFAKLDLSVCAIEVDENIFLVSTVAISQSDLEVVLGQTIGLRANDFKFLQLEIIPRTPAGKIDYREMERIIFCTKEGF